jgi:hypothetical protein
MRIHRVAGLSGDRMALITTGSCRGPHHTISDVGRIGVGHLPVPGEVSRGPTTACASSMSSPSAEARSSMSCAGHSRRDVLCTRSLGHTRPGCAGGARGGGPAGDSRHERVSVGSRRQRRAYGAWRVAAPRCVAGCRRERLTAPSTRLPRALASPPPLSARLTARSWTAHDFRLTRGWAWSNDELATPGVRRGM